MINNIPTILPPEMKGVAFFTGFRGYGKTFLASQADLPQNIAFFDFESKGEGIDAQLHFGSYRALTQEAGDNPQQLFNVTQSAFNEIPANKFTVAILDNISPLELAMNAEVTQDAEKYAARYGLNVSNIRKNRFGGSKAIVNFMIADMCAKLHAKGIRLIIATSHIKPRWGPAGPMENKFNIKGADKWQELSILTLILIAGTRPPVPGVLVQKEQLGTISINPNPSPENLAAMMRGEAGHTVSRRLPPKIGECTFQRIRYYLQHPATFENLEDHEKPTYEERDPFDKIVSKEQLHLMTLALEQQKREEDEDKDEERIASLQPIVDGLKKLKLDKDNLPPLPQLGIQLQEIGITAKIPQIAQAITIWKST